MELIQKDEGVFWVKDCNIEMTEAEAVSVIQQHFEIEQSLGWSLIQFTPTDQDKVTNFAYVNADAFDRFMTQLGIEGEEGTNLGYH